MKKIINKLKRYFSKPIPESQPVVRQEITEKFQDGLWFYVGDKVILLSNEPRPISVGRIKSFVLVGKGDNPLTLVEVNGEEFFTMGIIVHYTEDMFHALNSLPPIEAWNFMAHPHAQLSEKYGVKYKTYR